MYPHLGYVTYLDILENNVPEEEDRLLFLRCIGLHKLSYFHKSQFLPKEQGGVYISHCNSITVFTDLKELSKIIFLFFSLLEP